MILRRVGILLVFLAWFGPALAGSPPAGSPAAGSLAAGSPAAGSPPPPPFAALTVTPNGQLLYDITTGTTTLPSGGDVVDQDTGVSLTAEMLRYVDGVYIEAEAATVSGSFGQLWADRLRIDVVASTLDAEGHLRLERDGLALTATHLHYDANIDVVEFKGSVGAAAPAFKAERVLLDTRNGDVLLVGKYSYHNGIITLTSPETGGLLQLRLSDVSGVPVYDASTEVSPDVLARFATVLN